MPEPDAIGFDPPAPVFFVNEERTVILEPLTELTRGLSVAIPNPWSETEEWVVGVIRGIADEWVLDVGNSFGKLSFEDGSWKCLGLARLDAIAQGLALESAGPKKFTDRLLKRTGKGKRK
jgi:hypothetical protein